MDSPDQRVPIGEVLTGLGVHPMLEGETPVEAYMVVKTIDGDGVISWCYRTTKVPNRQELLGVLTVQVDLLRRELLDDWID